MNSHSDGDESVGGFRLELVIAVLLGLAALVGALSAYFGHVAEGHSIPIARVQAMHEGRRRARERRARSSGEICASRAPRFSSSWASVSVPEIATVISGWEMTHLSAT